MSFKKLDTHDEYALHAQKYMTTLVQRLTSELDTISLEKILRKYNKSLFSGSKCIVYNKSIHRIIYGKYKRLLHWKFPKYFQLDMLDKDSIQEYFSEKWGGKVKIELMDHWATGSAHICVIFKR